jgi:hypothetical protein
LVYGIQPGPDQTDGGPTSTVAQGSVVTNSAMGKLWVSGNILPLENMDHYSTISAPNPVPKNAQVTTYRALELRDRVVPDVGTKYRSPEEQTMLSEMAAAMQGPAELRILSVTAGLCVLGVTAPSGSRNDLQISDTLESSGWTSLTNFTGNGDSAVVISAPAGIGSRFYRVVTIPN